MEFLLKIFAKETIKNLWKRFILPLLYRDDKFRPQRLARALFIIAFGFGLYYLPNIIPELAIVFDIYDPSKPSLEGVSGIVYNLDNNSAYQQVSRYLLAVCYLTLLVGIALIIVKQNYNKLSKAFDDQRSIINFARSVKLSDGSRCAKDEELQPIVDIIAEKIKESSNVRVMAVNAYNDLLNGNSKIRHALEEKGRNLRLKVLLLDPYSEYAQERCKHMLPDTPDDIAWMRYITDSCNVVNELKTNHNYQNGKVEYSLFCSKPFFRFYLLDNDLFIQAYENNKHGHRSPMYHFESGDNSLYQLGQDMFSYHWKRSFIFDSESLKLKGPAFTIFLAKQYKILSEDDDLSNIEELRNKVIQYANSKREEAHKLEESGALPDMN